MTDTSKELIDVIDANDTVIDQVQRHEAYTRLLRHRIVHVMIVRNKQIYVVRRGLTLRYLPGFYCTSAGGHALAGESYEYAATRELQEELGVNGQLVEIDTFDFRDEVSVRIGLFLLEVGSDLEPVVSEREVLEGRFLSAEEIDQLDRSIFHPQLEICLSKTREFIDA